MSSSPPFCASGGGGRKKYKFDIRKEKEGDGGEQMAMVQGAMRATLPPPQQPTI